MSTWIWPLFPSFPSLFLSLSLALLLLVAYLAWREKTAPAAVVLFGAALSASFGYLDRMKEISVTATGVKATLQDASNAVEGLKKLATLTGTALINLHANAGAIGGNSIADREEFKRKVLDTLRSIGVSGQDLEAAESADRDRDMLDLLFAIRNHVYYHVLTQPNSPREKFMNDFESHFEPRPDPDVVQGLLKKYDVGDDFTGSAIGEYRSLFKNYPRHDEKFWQEKEHWPVGP